MKKRSVFGAIALSAVMAMGAVPAFAAPAPVELQGTDVSGNADDASDNGTTDFQYSSDAAGDPTASTEVNVFYNAEQIQATIPIEITIVATGDSATQGDIIAPTNYRIENNSTTKSIKVKTITAVGKNQGWNLGTMSTSGTTNNGGSGILDLDLKPTGADDSVAVALESASSGVTVTDAAWTINKKDAGADAAQLNLDLTGTSKINQGASLNNNKLAVDGAFTITYTVGLA